MLGVVYAVMVKFFEFIFSRETLTLLYLEMFNMDILPNSDILFPEQFQNEQFEMTW